jgi:mRNA-degrading endonuclease RelE of RelBE toxin-antitoxin system
MSYTIIPENYESRWMKRFPKDDKERINKCIEELKKDPLHRRPTVDIKPLKTLSNGWEVRVGHYRIGYTVDEGKKY